MQSLYAFARLARPAFVAFVLAGGAACETLPSAIEPIAPPAKAEDHGTEVYNLDAARDAARPV